MRICIILITVFLNLMLNAQETKVTNDLLAWYGVGLSKDITKTITFDLEKEFRFNKNGAKLYKHLTFSNIYIEPINNLYIGLAVKFIRDKNKEDVFEDEYTHILQTKYKNKLYGIEYSARLRFEQNNNKLFQLNNNEDISYTYRPKIKLSYKIKDSAFKPFIGTELFYLDSQDYKRFEKIRFDIGSTFRINKNNLIKAFYRIEQELAAEFPFTYSTIGIFYTHKL